jgi:hypothetical protein
MCIGVLNSSCLALLNQPDGFESPRLRAQEKRRAHRLYFPEPLVPVMIPQGFWIAARPPIPHASALFVDFMLSKSEIMAGQGRWVSRKDVKYLVDPGQKKLQVVSYEKWGDRTNELVQTYNKLIMREGH